MFEFKQLPYGYGDISHVLSAKAVEIHYDKHHKGYYNNLVKLVKDTKLETQPLTTIIKQAKNPTLFNNAAQVFNHDFFWQSISPEPQDVPDNLMQTIVSTYNTFDHFKEMFLDKAAKHFGSGWIWLVRAEDEIELWTTHDADTPVTKEHVTPLLTVDLWEHAYYVDFLNDRKEYLNKVFTSLNWNFANTNLKNSM